MQTSKKLLIRLSSAGDVLLTSPLLKIIREREPDSEIHFVVKSSYADLVRLNPNVDRLHLVQEGGDIHELERLRKELISERFELTLDLHNNFRSVYLRRGTAPEIRVITKDIFKRTLLVRTKFNFFRSVRPVALKYAQTYDSSVTEVPRPEVFVAPETIAASDRLWTAGGKDSRPSVFLCPGARHFTKRWPANYWRTLTESLTKDYRVVLLGSIEDSDLCHDIANGLDVYDFAGRLSIMESTAMLTRASAVVTNDSYLMHAANALGKKVVALFGSTVREFGFFPYAVENRVLEVDGLSCRPCSHIGLEECPRSHFKCMMETTPQAVEAAVRALLKS